MEHEDLKISCIIGIIYYLYIVYQSSMNSCSSVDVTILPSIQSYSAISPTLPMTYFCTNYWKIQVNGGCHNKTTNSFKGKIM